MAMETMMTGESWPVLGNPVAPPVNSLSPEDPNPEWEMISDEENDAAPDNGAAVVVVPGATPGGRDKKDVFRTRGRPRSSTVGHSRDVASGAVVAAADGIARGFLPSARATLNALPRASSTIGGSSGGRHHYLRRCSSTPDLMASDNAHELIVEDESDSEDPSSSEDDAELIKVDSPDDDDAFVDSEELEAEESFEVLADKNQEATDEKEEEEPVMIDEDSANNNEEESATLVSAPSMGMSSWTMASSAAPAAPSTGVWGMKKSPSFKDMLAKNIGDGDWGEDKALTEAKLRDSHRRHHLRVRTKPKFVVGGGNGMKHANSTGDLTKMLTDVEGGHESTGYGHAQGRHGRHSRRMKKQLSAMMEEEEEGADFVIGRGSGTGSGSGGGGGGYGDVLGETDAADYYRRKEHGGRSARNKAKERPDEAKRREISLHKKEMQRRRQAAGPKGGGGDGGGAGGGGKKKKKGGGGGGFGGKKERRRL